MAVHDKITNIIYSYRFSVWRYLIHHYKTVGAWMIRATCLFALMYIFLCRYASFCVPRHYGIWCWSLLALEWTPYFHLSIYCILSRVLQAISSVWQTLGFGNYANPVYDVATICHQVRWLRWGHPSLFHTATSLLIWYKMFCMREISCRHIWMEFINRFSVYAQSGTHSRFNW